MRLCKKSCAVMLAMCMLLLLCPVAAAAESIGEAPMTTAGDLLREGVPAEGETEIEFFDDLKAEKRIRDTLFVVGAVFALCGVGGYICMFVWRYANKRRDRTQETRDGILHEIERAEQRNQQQKENEQNLRENAPIIPEKSFETQENDVFATLPVQAIRETPIVPSTPISMQPGEKSRVRLQTGSIPQYVQPVTVRPMQPAAEPEQAAVPEEKSVQYDVDEILKEVREGKI